MKREFAILKALLRDFQRAIKNPKIAKMLICSHTFHDERVRRVCRELLLADGDWDTARKAVCAGHSEPWQAKLYSWAEKVKGGVK